jgi:hypothetical protein
MARTLHQGLVRDLSEVPILFEPPAPEAFIPGQPDAPAENGGPGTAVPPEADPEPSGQALSEQALSEQALSEQALSERDRAVLAFEKQHWKYAGAKEQAIRDRFELSATRYYQVLNALLDRPEAQEFEPVLVKRLRRQRAARQRARSGPSRPHPTAREN